METITLTINGNTISARSGLTILEVARQQDIYIPTLCHHEALRPIGACRLCQVEDEKRGVVVPACVTKAQQGMVIATDSPRVVQNRKNIIRLLLASHPESCVVCEKGNRCELRRLAAQMGVGHHGLDAMPYHPTVIDLNPFLSRDLSKCIMCAKCIRADQEVVVEGVIDYNFRGFDARPSTLFEKPLEEAKCTFCGTCLTVCPTGAIAEKGKHRLDHAGFRSPSVCSFCACGCSIYLEHDYNQVLDVSPTAKDFTSNGISLCVKGHFGHDYLNSPNRLRSPLLKTDEGFRPISWDEALDLISERLAKIRDDHGPESLGFMGSARATNEENYLFQKLARTVFGANNVDFASGAGWSAVFRILRESTGFSAGTSSFKDVENSDMILVIGADPVQTAPVLGYHIKRAVKNNQARLVAVDPVKTKLTALAELWLRPKVGTDLDLLKGLLKVILEEDLIDREFVTTKTRNFETLRKWSEEVSVAESAENCGVSEKDLREAARLFASASAAMVVFGHGLVQQAAAADLVRLLTDLVLVTGNLGKTRAGLVPVLKEANAQGALDMGLAPDLLPGQRSLTDEAAVKALQSVWGAAPPPENGLDSWRMFAAAREGRLKGLYILAENPVGLLPDEDGLIEALSRLDFLVVQDMFFTETAKLAHLVLPAAAWAEKDGTVTNLERRVQRLNRAVLSPGDFPPDWQILSRLAERLGHPWGYSSLEDVTAELEQAAPLYAGLTEVDLNSRAVFWPQPGFEEVVDTLPHGIGYPDGKAVFLIPESRDDLRPSLDGEHPYLLMQGHIVQQFGSGARSNQSKRLMKAAAGVYVGISPEDGQALGLVEGDRVRVVSAKGSVEVPVRLDPGLPAGLLFMPASFSEVRPNKLFTWDWHDPKAAKNIKHCPVRLERL